jgi:hypothetical protein
MAKPVAGSAPNSCPNPDPSLPLMIQIAEIPRALDLQHVDAAGQTFGPALHQAQYPAHS